MDDGLQLEEPGNGPGRGPVGPLGLFVVGSAVVAPTVVALSFLIGQWPDCDGAQPQCSTEVAAAAPATPVERVLPTLVVEPSSGPGTGQTEIRMAGVPAGAVPAVTIGDQAAVDVSFAAGVVRAKTPPGKPGSAIVRLTRPGAGASPPEVVGIGLFVYEGPISLVDVTPDVVSPCGGSTVTLTGSGFARGMSVTIGGREALATTVSSERSATVKVAPSQKGAVNVTVRLGSSEATLAGRLRVECPPPEGQELLILVLIAGALGAALHGLRSFVMYVGARKLVWSWLALYLTLPLVGATLAVVFHLIITAGLLSMVDAQPGFGAIGAAALVGLFSSQALAKLKKVAEGIFEGAPRSTEPLGAAVLTVSALSPQQGISAGGEVITLSGSGFGPDTSVKFGDAAATELKVVSDSILQVTTPPLAVGTALPASVNVVVERPNRAPVTLPAAFTYR